MGGNYHVIATNRQCPSTLRILYHTLHSNQEQNNKKLKRATDICRKYPRIFLHTCTAEICNSLNPSSLSVSSNYVLVPVHNTRQPNLAGSTQRSLVLRA